MKLYDLITDLFRNRSKEFESYKPFLKDLSKKVKKGYVASRDERKRLNDIGWEAKGVMEGAGYVLSLSSINSLPPPQSRDPLLYVVRFQSIDEKRQAEELALEHGAVGFIGDDNTLGLTSHKQFQVINENELKYELHFDHMRQLRNQLSKN